MPMLVSLVLKLDHNRKIQRIYQNYLKWLPLKVVHQTNYRPLSDRENLQCDLHGCLVNCDIDHILPWLQHIYLHRSVP